MAQWVTRIAAKLTAGVRSPLWPIFFILFEIYFSPIKISFQVKKCGFLDQIFWNFSKNFPNSRWQITVQKTRWPSKIWRQFSRRHSSARAPYPPCRTISCSIFWSIIHVSCRNTINLLLPVASGLYRRFWVENLKFSHEKLRKFGIFGF